MSRISIFFVGAAVCAALFSSTAAAQIDPGMRIYKSLGATRGQTVRITVINFSESQACSCTLKFVAPSAAGVTTPSQSFRIAPGQIAKLDLSASALIPGSAPMNERVEIGGVIAMAEPPDTAAPCQASMQVFNDFSGATTGVAAGK